MWLHLSPKERTGYAVLFCLLLTIAAVAGYRVSAASHSVGDRATASHVQGRRGAGRSPKGLRKLIDLNRASPGALQLVPGIGQKIALDIVRYRNEHGPFASVEDLKNVPEVGESRYAQVAPYFEVR